MLFTLRSQRCSPIQCSIQWRPPSASVLLYPVICSLRSVAAWPLQAEVICLYVGYLWTLWNVRRHTTQQLLNLPSADIWLVFNYGIGLTEVSPSHPKNWRPDHWQCGVQAALQSNSGHPHRVQPCWGRQAVLWGSYQLPGEAYYDISWPKLIIQNFRLPQMWTARCWMIIAGFTQPFISEQSFRAMLAG